LLWGLLGMLAARYVAAQSEEVNAAHTIDNALVVP
jgi:hypothetical protein